jgi:hypothetical protein
MVALRVITVNAVMLGLALVLITGCGEGDASTRGTDAFPIRLSGDQITPPVETGGHGTAQVKISDDESRIDVVIDLSGEFTSEIIQVVLYRSATMQERLVMVAPPALWVCVKPSAAPGDVPPTPECPLPPATLTRSFTSNDMYERANVSYGDFLTILREGEGYIYVQTERNLMGEIRGQVILSES